MDIIEKAKFYYEKQQADQELGLLPKDEGDIIYCRIGELLAQLSDEELAAKIDMLILEMSDSDRQEYFIKGFTAAMRYFR